MSEPCGAISLSIIPAACASMREGHRQIKGAHSGVHVVAGEVADARAAEVPEVTPGDRKVGRMERAAPDAGRATRSQFRPAGTGGVSVGLPVSVGFQRFAPTQT
jgi:hypothetical protein